MTKEVCIHIGAHKSASTVLQRTMRSNHDLIEEHFDLTERTRVDFSKTPFYLTLYKAFRRTERTLADLTPNARLAFNEIVETCGKANLFISTESFLGHCNLAEYGGIYPHSGRMLKAMRAITSDHKTKIILVVRRQADFIESCYMQQIKEGRFMSFDEFINDIDFDQLSWCRIADDIAEHFGRESTYVFPFELIKHGTENFLNRIFSVSSGFRPGVADLKFEKKANPSMANVGVDVARAVYPILQEHEVDDATYRAFRAFIFHNLPSTKFPRTKYMSPELSADIMNRCAEDNRRLFKQYMPDMDASAYLPKVETA